MSSEQKKFFNDVLENRQVVYSTLTNKVFFDALSSAYPLFYKEVDKKKFEKIVCEFMQYGAKNVKMWKMPNEFRIFIKKKKLFREIAYVDDLLWFEWSEVKLMMKNYNNKKISKFSFENSYVLSRSCVLKKLDYRVFEESKFDLKGKFYLLGYYDFENFRVVYSEITKPLYLFLKKMDKKGITKAIAYIAKMSDENRLNVKEFFQETLEDLNFKQILHKKSI